MQSIYERAREFGYVNARLRAAKPQLLSKDTLNSLCEVESAEGMIEILLGTSYALHIESLRVKAGGLKLISRAVMSRFSKMVGMIERMIMNPEKRELLYIATGRFDVYNIKNLLIELMKGGRGDYIDAGGISGRRLEMLRGIKDIDVLKKVLGDLGYGINEESYTYAEIVEDVEKAYFKRLKELKLLCSDEHEVRMYIEKIIDYKNFDLAARKGKDADFIDGGSIPEGRIKAVAKKGIAEVVKLFRIEGIYEKSKGDISWMEELYDREILNWIIRAGSANPFSMGGVIGFIRRLDVERRNVRSIGSAKNVLSAEEIKNRIIW